MENKRNSFRIYIIIGIVLVFAIVSMLVFSTTDNIKKIVVVEAGEKLPEASVFLIDSTKDAKFVTDIFLIDVNKPGSYNAEIKCENRNYKVTFEIKDTVAPVAEIINVDLYESRIVEPQEYIKVIKDVTDVSVKYKTEPEYDKIGNQVVFLLLEDTSGNLAEYKSSLRISKVKEIAEVDISEGNFNVSVFLKDQADLKHSSLVDTFFPNSIGVYPVKISVRNTIYYSSINVVDKIPPDAKSVNREFWTVDEISADDFVTEIIDATNVTVSFVQEPDYTQIGEQIVRIKLIDQQNNETIIEAMLTLKKDTEAPMIYGVQDNTAFIDTPISYKKGVYVLDNRDTDIVVAVDSSRVNIKKEGSYKVVYSAVDASGNITNKEVSLSVIQKPDDLIERAVVEELANSILEKIITEDMTLEEKALALYKYINKNVYYLGGRHSDDLITEAYYALIKDPGDCYTYFAASDLLLNMVGIPNIRVERLKYEGESNHYWHMINCADGWYHFDPSVHSPAFFSFMLTDAEAKAYSIKKYGNEHYYRHDKAKYPQTPDK